MDELIYDTGALIAAEHGDAQLLKIHDQHLATGRVPFVPTVVVAQAWRDGKRQARLAKFLRACNELEVITSDDARRVGWLLAKSGTADVVDGYVVLTALHFRARIVTSDPRDLKLLTEVLGVPLDITIV